MDCMRRCLHSLLTSPFDGVPRHTLPRRVASTRRNESQRRINTFHGHVFFPPRRVRFYFFYSNSFRKPFTFHCGRGCALGSGCTFWAEKGGGRGGTEMVTVSFSSLTFWVFLHTHTHTQAVKASLSITSHISFVSIDIVFYYVRFVFPYKNYN